MVYKTYLIETYKPKTVNLRIQALNKYLVFVGKTKLRLKSVKVQQRSYLENVISNADYTFLKNKLKKEDNLEWYFVVRFLAATGARVSELVQIKVEHVQVGYYDIYTKGGKIRRIYIPKTLRTETEKWLQTLNRTSGYLFLLYPCKTFYHMTCIYQLACFFYFCYFLYLFSYVTPLQKVD